MMKKTIKVIALILAIAAVTASLRGLILQTKTGPAIMTGNYASLAAGGKELYCGMEAACAKGSRFMVFPMEEYCASSTGRLEGLTQQDLAVTAYLEDHPEEMRVTGVAYTHIPFLGLSVGVLTCDNDVTEEKEAQGLAAAERLCQSLEGLTEREQVWALYQALTSTVTYCADDATDHTMYAALVEREACCEGIAKAMSWCLSRLGIENRIIVANLPSGRGHAWNSVKLDGVWYEFDPTGDLGREPEGWRFYLAEEELHPGAQRFFAC